MRDGAAELLTKDHSVVQEMVDAGTLTPEEAENHPRRNVITRAVGAHEAVELDRVEGVVFLDGRTLVSAVGDPATFHEDGIHLTPAGASIVADAMVEILAAPSPP